MLRTQTLIDLVEMVASNSSSSSLDIRALVDDLPQEFSRPWSRMMFMK